MKAARIHEFGPPNVIVIDDLPQPTTLAIGQVLMRVAAAAGVGPWDALIREGKSRVAPRPPLTLGLGLSGEVEFIGPEVTEFKVGDNVYGVTNKEFCGANAECALASADMLARSRTSYATSRRRQCPLWESLHGKCSLTMRAW